jgi:hypothetical protein
MSAGNDVFISCKNLDDDGVQTRDAEIAVEVYNFLTGKGLRVFLSNFTLEQLGAADYSREIDSALDSASALLAIGTSADHLNSEWVRYEWNSFANDIRSRRKPNGRIFTYIEGMPITDLPRTLRENQTVVRGQGSLDRLYNFINNALPPSAEKREREEHERQEAQQRQREKQERMEPANHKAWKPKQDAREPRLIPKLSLVAFIFIPLTFFLPFNSFSGYWASHPTWWRVTGLDFVRGCFDNDVLGNEPETHRTFFYLFALLCPLFVLVLSFFKNRNKSIVEVILSWIGFSLLATWVIQICYLPQIYPGYGLILALVFAAAGAALKTFLFCTAAKRLKFSHSGSGAG